MCKPFLAQVTDYGNRQTDVRNHSQPKHCIFARTVQRTYAVHSFGSLSAAILYVYLIFLAGICIYQTVKLNISLSGKSASFYKDLRLSLSIYIQ